MTSTIGNIQPESFRHHGTKTPLMLDFIGDVHGYADELENLLLKLGYKHHHNVWKHPQFKAVFVGDFINRGPSSKRCLNLVRAMVEEGSAYAILGNHELNAIYYFTTKNNGLPIRMPGPANKKLLDKIRFEYNNEKQLEHDIKWLRKLPLFIDFKQVRVVHAYWNNNYVQLLHGAISEGKLKRKFLKEMVKGGTTMSKALMQTTKGVEFCFPPNLVVKDNFKVRRMCYRVKWWSEPHDKTFEEISLETKFRLPAIPVPPQLIVPFEVYGPHEPPLFVGHYCVGTQKTLLAPNICCVDACVANGGKLAAYRWTGESVLSEEKLVFVEKVTVGVKE